MCILYCLIYGSKTNQLQTLAALICKNRPRNRSTEYFDWFSCKITSFPFVLCRIFTSLFFHQPSFELSFILIGLSLSPRFENFLSSLSFNVYFIPPFPTLISLLSSHISLFLSFSMQLSHIPIHEITTSGFRWSKVTKNHHLSPFFKWSS